MELMQMASIGQFAVGATYRDYIDERRRSWVSSSSRPLITTIWYPTDEVAKVKKQCIAVFQTGHYAINATISQQQPRYPLIVVSHGTGGSSASIAWLCVRLASAGFIAAAINHHGNTAAEPQYLLEGMILWWERAKDIRCLLDHLLADEVFAKAIDSERIGVAGFSIGGFTALACAGARLEMNRWKSHCALNQSDSICKLPPEMSFNIDEVWHAIENNPHILAAWPEANECYRDSRIKAAFGIAPVAKGVVSDESLQSIDIPVHLVAGSADDQAAPENNAKLYAAQITDSTLEILPNVTHYTFLSEGVWWAKLFDKQFLRDPKGVNRRKVHDTTASVAVSFFYKNL
ncbi:serine aminopeptidase domain-containing protein [Chitinibacter tainanensis]|uniref:alpha/beta hydrolase family protein n=1 Tax=Chitinibacter tainanensis TaxID=230667 RepID=UPI002356460A|nr:alpha/beta hydrolase [Chitinibacter tainanensis]